MSTTFQTPNESQRPCIKCCRTNQQIKESTNQQPTTLNTNTTYLSYQETGSFSKLVADYIDQVASLQPFLACKPDLEGVKKAIAIRKDSKLNNRAVLVDQLIKQYANTETSDKVKANIQALTNDNAYTICTAHQPNLFTGHLYFIYKILHAVKLADMLNQEIPEAQFIPVFYMGSEDADLEELGQVTIHGKKIKWDTHQTGAVGRMQIDDKLLRLIDEVEGQLSVEEYGPEIISLLKTCYVKGQTIEQATFLFVNALFKEFGLVVLLPDSASLKRLFQKTIKEELTELSSSKKVAETIAIFPSEYKVQAIGRDINLFYLKKDLRARIEKTENGFSVAGTNITFSHEAILNELESYPERFSPNVITRPLYQETILPNIAFIGGGAELAYWLELKSTFEEAGILFPVLLLRNSFMVIDGKTEDKLASLNLNPKDFFQEQSKILAHFVTKRSSETLSLASEKEGLTEIYRQIANISSAVDPTLQKHVQALSAQALNRLHLLEKKLLKVEKRKFETEEQQISKIKSALFPGGTLQERVDNLLPYYATYGKNFLKVIYDNSLGLNMQFCILKFHARLKG